MQYFEGRFTLLLIIISSIFVFWACDSPTPMDLSKASIIPKPVSLEATGSSLKIAPGATISYEIDNPEMKKVGQMLSGIVDKTTGVKLEKSSDDTGTISLVLNGEEKIGSEGYKLNITEGRLELSANSVQGLFMGVQTIRQLLPAVVDNTKNYVEIATGTIIDYPEYSYRGSMLDVARHFFGVDIVKKYIDFLASYKMNVLHLHLTDDQGWRIEIKSWPNLTAYGSLTEVGGGKGGFFTQDDYREIVRYAAERYILIIPEIDMPGHTNAALASYPELHCDGQGRMVANLAEMSVEYPGLYTGIEVGFSTLCANKELTYKMIGDVVQELAAITPGPYIHIGGDESHSTEKEDYIPFIERVQEIVKANGKQMIGWDETAQSAITSGSVVQLWHNEDYAKEAVSKGAKLIMSPAHKAYMDMQYDSTSRLGLHWAAYIEVDEGYNWDPVSIVNGITREDIIGIEAPLWSETITNLDDIEYLAFPRLPGYAEIGWTPVTLRNWDEYKIRLAAHEARFNSMNIDFYRSERVPWSSSD